MFKENLNLAPAQPFLTLVNKQKFIDKSLFIEKILADISEVRVFTYPPQSGKSINLSMLYTFLSNQIEKEAQKIFSQLKIASSHTAMQHLGKHSVIFLDFNDMKPKNYDQLIKLMADKISKLYQQHNYLLHNLSEDDKENFINLISGNSATISDVTLESSLKLLSKLITQFNQSKGYNSRHAASPFILIDGYDRLSSSLEHDEALGERFFSTFLTKALKDNIYLSHAALVGASENIDLMPANAIYISIDDFRYINCFGVSDQEVKQLLEENHFDWDHNKLQPDFYYIEKIFHSEKILLPNSSEFKKYNDSGTLYYRERSAAYNPHNVTNYIENYTTKACFGMK